MRISDWSSDVCSSDLHLAREVLGLVGDDAPARAIGLDRGEHVIDAVERPAVQADLAFVGVQERLDQRLAGSFVELRERRSEEHTSELQSLMRISYAVFCLKQKKTKHDKQTHTLQSYHINSHTEFKHTQ